MDTLSIIQAVGVIGAIGCWIAASVLITRIRTGQGKDTPWYRTFMWWMDYHEMRQSPGAKPAGYETLTTVFWAFLAFGLVPNILRIFI